jgi:hypothetical protein
MDENDLLSFLLAVKIADIGLLTDNKFCELVNMADEEELAGALKHYASQDTSRQGEIDVIILMLSDMEPDFRSRTLDELRLSVASSRLEPRFRQSEEINRFDWSSSLLPILSSAATHGLEFDSDVALSSEPVAIPPAKADSTTFREAQELDLTRRSVFLDTILYRLTWEQGNMIVLLTSNVPTGIPGGVQRIVQQLLDESPKLVANKPFIFWIIDDIGALDSEARKSYIKDAHDRSKGLKNPFIAQITPASAVNGLLKWLLGKVPGSTAHDVRLRSKNRS